MDRLQQAWAWMPQGGTLPRSVLVARHRGVLVLLWAHVPALAALSLLRDWGALHTVADVVPVAVLAALASRQPLDRTARRVCATLGLLLCSAAAVHLSDGRTEAHFHFFIVLALVALYEDWTPFLLAIGFVAVHHATLSLLVPRSVFDHPDALAHPVRWALVHAAFVLAAACAHVVAWRSSEQGSHDALTGLASGGLLVRHLERALERGPAAVVYLDLDGFKQVNDRLGHVAGDTLLAAAARRMELAVRDGDRVGRLGGDEFAVVLPGADAQDASVVAARLVAEMAAPFPLSAGTGHVGVSAGVAVSPRGSRADGVLAAADDAMYSAKRAGKGCFALAGAARGM